MFSAAPRGVPLIDGSTAPTGHRRTVGAGGPPGHFQPCPRRALIAEPEPSLLLTSNL